MTAMAVGTLRRSKRKPLSMIVGSRLTTRAIWQARNWFLVSDEMVRPMPMATKMYSIDDRRIKARDPCMGTP